MPCLFVHNNLSEKGIPFPPSSLHFTSLFAGVMELVDVVDSKSTDGDIVPVRVRPPAPWPAEWSPLTAGKINGAFVTYADSSESKVTR